MALRGERVAGGIAQAGVGELRVLHGVAHEADGDGTAAGVPLKSAGDGGDEEVKGRGAAGDGEMREGELQLAAEAEGVLLRGRNERADGRRGAGREVLAGGVGADGLGNGDEAGCAGLGLGDRRGGGAIGLAGVEKDGAGDGGDARVNAERCRGLEGRLDGGELRVAGSAAAIVEQRSAAEPAASNRSRWPGVAARQDRAGWAERPGAECESMDREGAEDFAAAGLRRRCRSW